MIFLNTHLHVIAYHFQVIQLGNGQQLVIPAGQVIQGLQGQTLQVQGSQPNQLQQVKDTCIC